MPFSAFGIHLLFHTDSLLNFLGQFFSYNSYTKLKCFTSVSSILNHSQIVLYTLMVYGFQGQGKNIWLWKIKNIYRMGSHEFSRNQNKMLLIVSRDLWAQNQKIVFHGKWNPKAFLWTSMVWSIDSCQKRYLPISVTWLYHGLKCTIHWGDVGFF